MKQRRGKWKGKGKGKGRENNLMPHILDKTTVFYIVAVHKGWLLLSVVNFVGRFLFFIFPF